MAQTHRLDVRRGVALQIVLPASKGATNVAVQGGAVDLTVSDWIWISRQRAEGRGYAFVPYSLAVGGLMVRPDADIADLDALRGQRLGVAGGSVDKSWLVLFLSGSPGKVTLNQLVSLARPRDLDAPSIGRLHDRLLTEHPGLLSGNAALSRVTLA